MMESERKLDDFEFIRAEQLAERIQEWQTDPLLSVGLNIYLEYGGGSGSILTRAVLLEKRLTDGSFVYNIRLS
jgi:hypothetical protein